MANKVTVLNIAASLSLAGIIFYTIFNYQQLASGEGWGVISMISLAGLSAFLLLIDFIIQKFVPDRFIVNVIGAAIVILAALYFFSHLK